MQVGMAATGYKYEIVVAELKKLIADGVYTTNLPSVRTMAREFGVDARTVMKAVEQLERERLVFADSTRGIRILTPDAPRPRTGIVNIVHTLFDAADGGENDFLLKNLHRALDSQGCRTLLTMQCEQTMGDPVYWAEDRSDAYLFIYGNEKRNLEPHRILTRLGRPMVYTSRIFGDDIAYDWVEFDHLSALAALYERLLAAGHRRIAFVEIAKPSHSLAQREEQYRDFMAEHALAFPEYARIEPLSADAMWDTNEIAWKRFVAEQARRLLRADRPPTAIVLMELPPEPLVEIFADAGLKHGRDYILVIKRSISGMGHMPGVPGLAGMAGLDRRFPALYCNYADIAEAAVRRLRAVMDNPSLPHAGTLVPVLRDFDGIARLPAGGGK